MDNHIHIAHNVCIGDNTAMAGMVGIAGSVRIGKNCKFGGQVGTVDHIEIVDNVTVLAKTLVTKSLTEPGSVAIMCNILPASIPDNAFLALKIGSGQFNPHASNS